jgi:D-3-phosphoglycerate dehydrogenase / 2-oxoglutarate reductase
MKKVIITAPVHPILISKLQQLNYEIVNQPDIDYNELLLLIPDATALVVTTRIKVDSVLIDAAPKLVWIGRIGSGMEKIDVAYATSKNILCVSSPEGNKQAVAEHVLGLILNLNHNICKSYIEINDGAWNRAINTGTELYGKTVGIIGFGNNGSAFAQLLAPFNVTILAYDKYKSNFSNQYITESTIEDIAKQADIISFHVPLTNETAHLINANFLSSLQKKPTLINACRGGIMDTTSIIEALKNNTISALGLDVLENEDLKNQTLVEKQQLEWLLQQTNVIITPHIAGYSKEANIKMAEIIIQKVHN